MIDMIIAAWETEERGGSGGDHSRFFREGCGGFLRRERCDDVFPVARNFKYLIRQQCDDR